MKDCSRTVIQSKTPQHIDGCTYRTAQRQEEAPHASEPTSAHLRRDDEPIRSPSVRTGVDKIGSSARLVTRGRGFLPAPAS
jgi:hypothetical protein